MTRRSSTRSLPRTILRLQRLAKLNRILWERAFGVEEMQSMVDREDKAPFIGKNE